MTVLLKDPLHTVGGDVEADLASAPPIAETNSPPLTQYDLFSSGAQLFRQREQSLDLLQKPAHPDLMLSLMVPVYRVFENRNLRNMLECLANQTETKEAFEIVFVVNNTKERMRQGLPDNQRTMACLQAIQEPESPIPVDMPADYRAVIEKARRVGLKVGFIDLATEGVPELNMGKIRKVGEEVAVARFESIGNMDGICHPLDADMLPARNFVRNLMRAYEEAGVDSVFALYDFAPTGMAEVYQTAAAYDFGKAHHAFERLAARPDTESIVWGGGLHGTRARVVRDTGGIPAAWEGEDEFWHQKLVRHGNYHVAPEIVITIEDEADPESFMGASRHRALGSANQGGYIPRAFAEYNNPVYGYAAHELNSLGPETNVAAISATLSRYGIPFDEQLANPVGLLSAIKERSLRGGDLLEFSKETERSRPAERCNASALVNALQGTFAAGLSPESVDMKLLEDAVHRQTCRAAIRQGYSQHLTDQALEIAYSMAEGTQYNANHFAEHPQIKRALEREGWMLERLTELRQTIGTKEQAKAALTKEFPDFVGCYDGSGLRHASAVFKGLNYFIRAVRSHPESYAEAAAHLERIGLYRRSERPR